MWGEYFYKPEDVKVCEGHLNEDGLVLDISLPGFRYIYRPQLLLFFGELRLCEDAKKTVGLNIDNLNR